MRRGLIILFWISFAAAMAVYAAMVAWSLPKLTAQAGGLQPFDLRPLGYSAVEAQAFLVALPEEGKRFYLGTQHMLDSFYPPLLALCLSLGLWLMTARWRTGARLMLAVPPVLGMICDLGENHFIAALLSASTESINDETVAAASIATVLKSIFTTVAMTALLVLTIIWGVRRWKAPA